MPMRVIAGTLRHRHLEYPENNVNIRPTKDRIREAFFSSMGDITDKSFLDLCAGCGSMGIEAISRGAKNAVFVDNNKVSQGFINKNIKSLNIENALLINKDIFEAFDLFKDQKITFDIVYFDPPYESAFYEDAIACIYNNKLLSDNGVLAFECNRKINVNPSWYSSIKEYHYGDITVVVLRK